jgi:hypothetical protein
MEDLLELIEAIEADIETSEPYIDAIPHPQMLVTSLRELYDLTGNESVKESMVLQLSHILTHKKRQATTTDAQSSKVEHPPMLNVLLYGPPGTGKTLIATKLAKIWWSLGYLRAPSTAIKTSKTTKTSLTMDSDQQEFLTEMLEAKNAEMMFNAAILGLYILWSIFSSTWNVVSSLYESHKYLAIFALLTAIAISAVLFCVLVSYLEEREEESVDFESIPGRAESAHTSPADMPAEKDIVKIVTRSDFVDRYVGWSDKKTLALLHESLGKVLFVDEAYSLCSGPYDTFGIEVLNTLNLFLSQHPGEIIVIFAGYKNLIEKRIFRVQPGLKRRFMWYFKCNGYTPRELFEIFQGQLLQRGLSFKHQRRISKLFRQYAALFENYGGDTERLAFFTELEHARDVATNRKGGDIDYVSRSQLKRAIKKLQDNRVQSEAPTNSNPLDMLENLYSGDKHHALA